MREPHRRRGVRCWAWRGGWRWGWRWSNWRRRSRGTCAVSWAWPARRWTSGAVPTTSSGACGADARASGRPTPTSSCGRRGWRGSPGRASGAHSTSKAACRRSSCRSLSVGSLQLRRFRRVLVSPNFKKKTNTISRDQDERIRTTRGVFFLCLILKNK